MDDMQSPPAKRLRQTYQHHHVLHHKHQKLPPAEPALTEQGALDKLLVDSIKTVCEEEGVKQDVYDPVIESVALEAFRNAVDECIDATATISKVSWLTLDSHTQALFNGPPLHAHLSTYCTYSN